jgi:uncharacterized protein (TIGR02598 family)
MRPITSTSSRRPGRLSAAFTLIEAVLAIGVVSFAMMGILGLVPVGLATFRNAMNLTVESAIVQELSGELQRTDFTNLAATNLRYNEQGVRVAANDARQEIYSVEVTSPQPLESGNLVAPSAASTVLIRVVNRAEPNATNCYSVVVPRCH